MKKFGLIAVVAMFALTSCDDSALFKADVVNDEIVKISITGADPDTKYVLAGKPFGFGSDADDAGFPKQWSTVAATAPWKDWVLTTSKGGDASLTLATPVRVNSFKFLATALNAAGAPTWSKLGSQNDIVTVTGFKALDTTRDKYELKLTKTTVEVVDANAPAPVVADDLLNEWEVVGATAQPYYVINGDVWGSDWSLGWTGSNPTIITVDGSGNGSKTFTAVKITGKNIVEAVGRDNNASSGDPVWSSALGKYNVSQMFGYNAALFDDSTVDTYKFRVNVIGSDKIWSIIKK